MNKEAQSMIESIQMNDLEAAAKQFKESVRLSVAEGDIEGLLELAETLHQLGFLEEAKEAYAALKSLSPETADWDIALAEIAVDQDNYDEALDILLAIDKDSEVYPQALLTMADAYQVQGLYEVSEQKIFEAMALLPDEPVLDFALAQLYHSIGEYKKAIPIYEELAYGADEMVSESQIYFLLGDCYNAVGEFEKALNYLEKVPEEEHHPDSYFQLGFTYYQLKEYPRAIAIFRKLIEADKDYQSAYLYLAHALEQELQLEEALAVMEQGIAQNPYQAEFYTTAANLQLKLNREEEAEASLMTAAELEPESSSIHLAIGNLLLKQERYDDVVTYISERKNQDESDPQYDWLLAKSYNELEDYAAAKEAYRAAYPHFIENESFLTEYAAFLREEGDWDTLSQVVHYGLEINPSNPELQELHDELHHLGH